MKKTLLLVLFFAFFLSACGPNADQTTGQNGNQIQPEQNKFSLKNALTAGQSLRCSYEMNGEKVTTLVKGDKYKIEGIGAMGESNNGGMVSDGTFMYMWDEESKKGTKYDIKVMQELDLESKTETDKEDYSQFDFQEWADTQENQYKVDCQPAVLTDAEFAPPSDVIFTDLTQTMVEMNELGKKMQANPNQMPSAEDIENMGELFKGMGAGSGENPTEE